jgi:hypothetical protein
MLKLIAFYVDKFGGTTSSPNYMQLRLPFSAVKDNSQSRSVLPKSLTFLKIQLLGPYNIFLQFTRMNCSYGFNCCRFLDNQFSITKIASHAILQHSHDFIVSITWPLSGTRHGKDKSQLCLLGIVCENRGHRGKLERLPGLLH